mgnify:CR=1 FL=1
MKNAIKFDELEKILLTNWTKFIDTHRLITFVLSNINGTEFKKINQKTLVKKSLKITLSQFRLKNNNTFEIWVDFTIPKKEGVIVGTCTMCLNIYINELKHLETIGNLFT